MSEWLLKTLRKSGDFQADYEGSIPVTRFNRDFVYRSLAGPPSPARRGI